MHTACPTNTLTIPSIIPKKYRPEPACREPYQFARKPAYITGTHVPAGQTASCKKLTPKKPSPDLLPSSSPRRRHCCCCLSTAHEGRCCCWGRRRRSRTRRWTRWTRRRRGTSGRSTWSRRCWRRRARRCGPGRRRWRWRGWRRGSACGWRSSGSPSGASGCGRAGPCRGTSGTWGGSSRSEVSRDQGSLLDSSLSKRKKLPCFFFVFGVLVWIKAMADNIWAFAERFGITICICLIRLWKESYTYKNV